MCQSALAPQTPMETMATEQAEHVVEPQADTYAHKAIARALVDGEQKCLGPHEVWLQSPLDRALAQRLEYQAELEVLEVPQSSVNELRRLAGGTRTVIPKINKSGLQTT